MSKFYFVETKGAINAYFEGDNLCEGQLLDYMKTPADKLAWIEVVRKNLRAIGHVEDTAKNRYSIPEVAYENPNSSANAYYVIADAEDDRTYYLFADNQKNALGWSDDIGEAKLYRSRKEAQDVVSRYERGWAVQKVKITVEVL